MKNFHSQIPLERRLVGYVVFILRHIFKRNKWLDVLGKKNVSTIVRGLEQRRTDWPSEINVDRVIGLDEKTFIEKYLNPGIPVIFDREAAHWDCVRKWDLEYFGRQFRDQEYTIVEHAGLTDSQDRGSALNIRPDEYVRRIRSGEKDYLRFCPIMESNPQLKLDLDQGWLRKMRKCFLGVSYQTFIGPGGRKTPLHSDTTAFFYIMASGKKKWWLYSPAALPLINPDPEGKGYNTTRVNIQSPDPESYPGFSLLQRYTCELGEGDVLFVPAWMWHEVENVTESWGVSYRFTSLRGFFQFPAYAFVRVLLTKGAFFRVLYLSFYKKDLPDRKDHLLTPRIFLDE